MNKDYEINTPTSSLPMGKYLPIIKQRKPGFDLAVVFWPVLFIFIHFLIQIVSVTIATLFVTFVRRSEAVLLQNTGKIDPFTYSIGTILYSLLLIIIYSLFIKHQSKREPRYILRAKISISDLAHSISVVLACLGISTLIMLFLLNIKDSVPFINKIMTEYLTMVNSMVSEDKPILSFVGTVILVPICEELLFRGIVFSELKRAIPARYAIFITGFLFALFHWQAVQSLYVFFAGVAITACYYYSSSIKVAILMHMTYNFFGGGLAMLTAGNEEIATMITVLELIFVPVGFLSFYILLRKHKYDPPKSSRVLMFPYRGTVGLYEDEKQLIVLNKSDKQRLGTDDDILSYEDYVEINISKQKDIIKRIYDEFNLDKNEYSKLVSDDSELMRRLDRKYLGNRRKLTKDLKKEASRIFAAYRF